MPQTPGFVAGASGSASSILARCSRAAEGNKKNNMSSYPRSATLGCNPRNLALVESFSGGKYGDRTALVREYACMCPTTTKKQQ
jgi:hypothetical protein